MDIEEFIEQDILVFLDKETEGEIEEPARPSAEEPAFLTRDYEKEFFAAIDDNSIAKAKRVLHDLKQKFDESPAGTAEREQLKALLTSLYEKFKDHLDAQGTYERLDAQLTRMGSGGTAQAMPERREPAARKAIDKIIEKAAAKPRDEPVAVPAPAPAAREIAQPTPAVQTPPSPTAPAPPPSSLAASPNARAQALPEPPSPAQALPQPKKAEPAREARMRALITHAHLMLDDVEAALSRSDPAKAARAYRLARKDALGLEDGVPTDLALRCSALFSRIRDAMRPAAAAAPAKAPDAPQRQISQPQPAPLHAALDHDLILQLEREKHALDAQLRRDDLASAMRTYKGMRIIAQQLTAAPLAEDTARKLVRIYRIIEQIRARGAHERDERSLARAVP